MHVRSLGGRQGTSPSFLRGPALLFRRSGSRARRALPRVLSLENEIMRHAGTRAEAARLWKLAAGQRKGLREKELAQGETQNCKVRINSPEGVPAARVRLYHFHERFLCDPLHARVAEEEIAAIVMLDHQVGGFAGGHKAPVVELQLALVN